MKACACGTLILKDWVDCGDLGCARRTNDLASSDARSLRTWRFKSLVQVSDVNREASIQLDRRAQELIIMTSHKVERDLEHENIQAMYRAMRREDLRDNFL